VTRHLCNAFSLNMLPADGEHLVRVRPVTLEEARSLARDAVSAVGHADTAAIFAAELEVPVANARATLRLTPGAELLVGQYEGPRLPEGATALPPGATLRWLLVAVERAP
jgi:hypothetical protein